MKRHLQLVPELSPEERTEARRRAVIADWWDASAELQRKRNAGTSTVDDVTAARVASWNLFMFQAENPTCCVGGGLS
jgi:hypothetical protein